MTAAEVFSTLFAAICWLAALSGHALLLKLLLTASERAKLRLPPAPETSSTFSSWPLLLPLLLSITTVDLATLLFAIPFTTISRIFADWTFGEVICRFSAFLGIAAVTVDSYAFLALVVVCCQIAQRKRRAHQGGGESSITKKKTFLIIGGIWLFALITALPALFYQKVTTIEDVLQETMDQVMAVFSGHYQQSNDLSSSLAKAMRAQANGLFNQHFCTPMGVLGSFESRYIYTFLQFFIPIFATMVIYVVMLIDKLQSGDLAEEFVLQQRAQLPPSEAAVMNNDAKFIRMILISLLVYHILWAPRNLFVFVRLPPRHASALSSAIFVLQKSSFFFKPFLYFAVNINFKKAVQTIGKPLADANGADSVA